MLKKTDLQEFTFLPHLFSDSSEPSGQSKAPSQKKFSSMQVTPSAQGSAGGKHSAGIIKMRAIRVQQQCSLTTNKN